MVCNSKSIIYKRKITKLHLMVLSKENEIFSAKSLAFVFKQKIILKKQR